MRRFKSNGVKNWARFATKLGLLLTEPKVRAAIAENFADNFKDGVDNVTDRVTARYADAAERVEAVGAAMQGRRYRPSPVLGFLVGVGVGAGLGILLAPAAGRETRDAIRDRVIDVKDRVVSSTSATKEKVRQSVSEMPFTGTEG